MLFKNVVGKLWVTILLLVCVILSLLTILLSGYFETYFVKTSEGRLLEHGKKIAKIASEDIELAKQISNIFSSTQSKVMIVRGEDVWYSDAGEVLNIPLDTIKGKESLAKVFKNEIATERFSIPEKSCTKNCDELIVGVPIQEKGESVGGVFIYQTLDSIEKTIKQTVRFIFLAAGIGVVLTTIFAFFLSTRITAPLRKMKEVAFRLTRGDFDVKVPVMTNDEIGELARAFNGMGKQLKYNISALRHEKEQLSSILSSMADGVITLSVDGEMIITNPPAEKILQFWYQELDLKADLLSPLPPELEQMLQHVIKAEAVQSAEITLKHGSWVVVMTPLYNQTKVRGVVAVFRDMSEERRLDKMRKDFITNVSHELRTPISMLQGYSEAILDGLPSSDEERNELVQVIYDESLRMGRLVNELLDLARMESGFTVLKMEEVELNTFVERVVKKFQGLARENNTTISFEPNATDILIRIDPDRIEQVVTNLIDNALRHLDEEGTVWISIEQKQDKIAIVIRDTGCGIPEQDLPYVFNRFYKADKARTRGRAGTGLGLAIVKNIIEAHKGTVSVHSELNKGTTFIIHLPMR
ncbi:MAG: ATP-binding protein [Bacillaceae bacterium]